MYSLLAANILARYYAGQLLRALPSSLIHFIVAGGLATAIVVLSWIIGIQATDARQTVSL